MQDEAEMARCEYTWTDRKTKQPMACSNPATAGRYLRAAAFSGGEINLCRACAVSCCRFNEVLYRVLPPLKPLERTA